VNKYSTHDRLSDAGANLDNNLFEWIGRYSKLTDLGRARAKLEKWEAVSVGHRKIRCAVISLRPGKQDWSSVTQTLWIDPDTQLIIRSEDRVGGVYGSSIIRQYSFLRVDAPAAPDTFIFTPPPGATRRTSRPPSKKQKPRPVDVRSLP